MGSGYRRIKTPRETECGVHQTNVRKGLREVPQKTLADWIVLLCQKPKVIANGQEPLEDSYRIFAPAL